MCFFVVWLYQCLNLRSWFNIPRMSPCTFCLEFSPVGIICCIANSDLSRCDYVSYLPMRTAASLLVVCSLKRKKFWVATLIMISAICQYKLPILVCGICPGEILTVQRSGCVVTILVRHAIVVVYLWLLCLSENTYFHGTNISFVVSMHDGLVSLCVHEILTDQQTELAYRYLIVHKTHDAFVSYEYIQNWQAIPIRATKCDSSDTAICMCDQAHGFHSL